MQLNPKNVVGSELQLSTVDMCATELREMSSSSWQIGALTQKGLVGISTKVLFHFPKASQQLGCRMRSEHASQSSPSLQAI